MLPTRLHSGVPHNASRNRMFPPTTDPADKLRADALNRWVERQKEEVMRNLPTDLEVLPSPLLLEQMEREAAQRQRVREGCSVPPPQLRRSPPASVPAAKQSSSSHRRNRRRAGVNSRWAGEEVVSLPADVRAAASEFSRNFVCYSTVSQAPCSKYSRIFICHSKVSQAHCSSAHASLARCYEATPEELEERLRFFARQIKSFKKKGFLCFSPEQMQSIKQMEEDYETAVRLFYCRPPSPAPSHKSSAAAAVEQPTSGLQHAAEFPEGHVLTFFFFLWGVLMELRPDTPQPDSRPDTPQPDSRPDTPQPDSRPDTPQPRMTPDPKSASTSSTRRRGRRKMDASAELIRCPGDTSAPAHATEGLCDAPAPAHATEGLCDAPAHATEGLCDAPAHATEGLCDAPAHATEGLCDAPAHFTEGPADASAPAPSLQAFQGFSEKLALILASEPYDEGFEEEAPPDRVSEGFKEQLVLVLASEPYDEGFEEEALPDPVPEGFKKHFVLVLASEPRDEGLPGSASVSEGSPSSEPVYEAPGSEPVYEAPGSEPVYEAPGSLAPA
ncbi:hypothetical protein CRENBAI_022065 [Crenichthys baileyi]|uniref:Uncharacterized protein n=1 Tax=Crenichthys baileyi TaxID=28760 RepID=A0AAV9SK73_9TELE